MGMLEGKVAIITGGASGIGLACAKLFAAEGAKLLITDLGEDDLKAAAEEIGGDTAWLVGNVTKVEDNEAMAAKAVELYGGIDILMANAGVEGNPAPILEMEESHLDFAMDVNVKGPWHGIRAVAPEMIKRGGGSVVVTSSIAATRGGLFAYTTSKHAVTGLVRSAAKQLAPMNIRVNSVNPGPVATPMLERLDDEVRERLFAKIPLGRFAEPNEIAQAMLYLASDQSSWITGTMNMADGGESC